MSTEDDDDMALQPQPVTARQLQLQQQQHMRSQQAAAAQQAPPARQGGNFPTLKIKVGRGRAWQEAAAVTHNNCHCLRPLLCCSIVHH
jgi:hypothetical protein